jgi:ligand-binding sensor domain-containing protein
MKMRRLLFVFLWLAVLAFVGQLVYFVFFSVRAPKYNEGRPLSAVALSSPVRKASAMFHDGTGNVWIGTEGDGVYCFDTTTNATQPITVPEGIKDSKIRYLAVDHDGRLWVGTLRDGLFVRCNEAWQHYGIGQHIPAIRLGIITS